MNVVLPLITLSDASEVIGTLKVMFSVNLSSSHLFQSWRNEWERIPMLDHDRVL